MWNIHERNKLSDLRTYVREAIICRRFLWEIWQMPFFFPSPSQDRTVCPALAIPSRSALPNVLASANMAPEHVLPQHVAGSSSWGHHYLKMITALEIGEITPHTHISALAGVAGYIRASYSICCACS